MTEKSSKKDFVKLLFIGAPLLDITARCNQDVLDSYGLKSDDCIAAKDVHEELFHKLFNDTESQLSAGGSSQNTARIAKWILRDKGRVSFTGCVGEDNFASRMTTRLQLEGVEPLYIPLSGETSGVCACLLNSEGDRSMCARLGAAALFARHHLLKEEVQRRLSHADCIFVEGYFFAHSPDVMHALVEKLTENQIFTLSLSAEYICKDHSKTFLSVLHRVDILFSNEAEAKAVAPALGLECHSTVEEIAACLATRDRLSPAPRIVVVTRGPNPVLVVRGSENPMYFLVPEGVKVVDSVGCGDAMAGAFLAVYVVTEDISKAVRTGISAAVEIAQIHGCNPTEKSLYPSET